MQPTGSSTNFELEQLKQVYDYAKFHIGLYAGVVGAFAAFLGLAGEEVKRRYKKYFIAVFSFLLAAGVCGGVVASNIVYTGSPEVLSLGTRRDGSFIALLREEGGAWSVSSCVVVAAE